MCGVIFIIKPPEMSKILQAVTDTISRKPEVGIFGSMVGVTLSPVALISFLSAVFGLAITIITLTIKVMDIIQKARHRKADRPDNDEIVVSGKKYRLVPEDDEITQEEE